MGNKKSIIRRDNPEQSKRFIDMARDVEAAETKEEAERAFKKVVKSRDDIKKRGAE